MSRVHEALTLPCSGCGAPLPVDPTAGHAFCGMCHAWREVPPELRQRAWAVVRAHWEAQAQERMHHDRALAERQRASMQRLHGVVALVVIGLIVVAVGANLLLGFATRGAATAESGDPIAIFGVLVRTVVMVGVVVVFALNAYAVFRLYQRHRARTGRTASKDWFQSDRTVPAVCGSCGAPLAFAPGEQSVTCGHCRTVVVASARQGDRLIEIALERSQLAALEAARSERARVKAELGSRRNTALMVALLSWGACCAVLTPALLVAYTLRTITRSAEQQMLDLARDLRGDFRAGVEGLFEWLDSYWIGQAPPELVAVPKGKAALFGSRWSVFAVYHDRPVLVLAWTGITDRFLRPFVLLARPRQRSPQTLSRAAASPAAARLRELGFEYVLDYPGVALRGPRLSPERFTAERVTELARAAYELAEEP